MNNLMARLDKSHVKKGEIAKPNTLNTHASTPNHSRGINPLTAAGAEFIRISN
jgi:hypothetical protein